MLEKFTAIIKKAQQLIHPWILPFTCILCGGRSDREQDLCSACYYDLPIITQSCQLCANIILTQHGYNYHCGNCLKHPPPFASTHALFTYEEPIISLLVSLKFHHHLAVARVLGELMAEKIVRHWYASKPLPDLIMPVPLHLERLRERGFNQALEITRPITAKLNLQLDYRSAQRIKNTPAQMKLRAETRQANIKNAFRISGDFRGKRIAIIDDVMTTGATAAEFSKALLEHGVESVEVWCCARVVL